MEVHGDETCFRAPNRRSWPEGATARYPSKPMSKTVQTVQTECSDYGYKKALDSQIDCRCSRTFDAKEDYY
jgi:hypothetical protein